MSESSGQEISSDRRPYPLVNEIWTGESVTIVNERYITWLDTSREGLPTAADVSLMGFVHWDSTNLRDPAQSEVSKKPEKTNPTRRQSADGVARAGHKSDSRKHETKPLGHMTRSRRQFGKHVPPKNSSSRIMPGDANQSDGQSPDRTRQDDMNKASAHQPAYTDSKHAVETALYIRIQDVIDDIGELGDLLTAKVNKERVEFRLNETAIKRSDTCTFCSATCPSHVHAKMLHGFLLKDRHKFTPLIDCSFQPFQQDHVGKNNPELRREPLKRKVTLELDSRSEEVLRKHDQKLRDLTVTIEKTKQNLHDLRKFRETRQEIEALEYKQDELEKQREEFKHAVNCFKTDLTALMEKDSYERDVQLLRKRFGVECYRLNKLLPVYARRRDIVQLVNSNQVSIIVAETGSGKSTQIVQFLLEAGLGDAGTIVCTQPRKVAAIALATHVAKEQAGSVGREVGYKVGSVFKGSPSTKLVFMTDHALLNECLVDPDLEKFSCVVVDEAHERSLYTDLLLAMLKRCLGKRPELRVIITSATIDPKMFVAFFGGQCPVMTIKGRTFPVDVVWEDADSEENDFDNYEDEAVKKAIEIHMQKPLPGDILVFLTSRVEIEKCCDALQQRMRDRSDFQCFPLHGQLQADEQQKVFEPLAGNKRKIVFATNCAETSITIDGIRYVVDTGVAKELRYDARKNVNSLAVTVISRSSADQRKGRAGRTAPGTCYRLYSHRSFQDMEAISLPEILKTHLGQALLKLAELGVGPDMYDFVQSPSPDAITGALQSLVQLGAMQDGKITDTGRWMARLPFDPKLGLLTLLGQKENMLYDAIVLAAVINAGSGVLYRGTTPEAQKKHDKAKARFSHTGGDFLAALAVYREWEAVGEWQQKKWCMDNSVNGKTMRGIRDNIKEVTQVLRRELKLDIAHTFSEAEATRETLRLMIFKCFATNLCHYLGLERAGYFAARAARQVHFHPSSSYNALASFPEWVVYNQIMKTSRDFITGITPVEDTWLSNITVDRFGIDVEDVRQRKVVNVHTQPAGSHAFFALVGPRYSKMRQYEDQFSVSSTVVIVEASKERGEVKVFSTESADSVQGLIDKLVDTAQSAARELQQDDREMSLGREESGLRVVLGQGGQVGEILMPNQSRKVFITRPSYDTTEDSILAKFKEFGEVKFWKQFTEGKNWGFLIFRSSEQARVAVDATKDDDCNAGQLERRRPAKQNADFKARLSWCRRPCKGTGTAAVSSSYLSDCLVTGHFQIGINTVRMKLDKHREDSLFLTGLPAEVTEDVVKRSLLHRVVCDENAQDIVTSVSLHRVKVGQTTQRDIKQIETYIREKFERRLTSSTVRVVVRKPDKDTRVMFSAEAFFTDPIEGIRACRALRNFSLDNGQRVEVTPVISATLFVQQRVLDACKTQYDAVLRHLDRRGVEVEQKPQRSNNVMVSIRAVDLEDAVKARTFLTDVFKGDVLDCAASQALQHLLTPAGRKFLQEAERETGAYVCVDNRLRTIAIHGSDTACTTVRIKMNDYLDLVLSGKIEDVTLKGGDNPAGVLKALITAHGDDLDGLRVAAGLHNLTVDYRRHKLTFSGNQDSLQKAKDLIQTVKDELRAASKGDKPEDEDMECVVCLCPVDVGDLYRLEICAHPYCKGCLKRQVSLAVTEHKVPIVCCQDGCDLPLAWRDFNNLSRDGHMALPALAKAAISAYVLSNRHAARFCTTPDCPMVYRVSTEDQAEVFQCPECGVRTCTACHNQSHDGITCVMLRSTKDQEQDVEAWARQDRERRRACPGCKCPIEKIEGCNKMICGACNTVFCWLCLDKFTNEQKCYAHLAKEHGGFYT